MSTTQSKGPSKPTAYGSAKDLPTYQDLAQQIRVFKALTRVVARKQRPQILELEREINRLSQVVDDFYDRLGARNWIFHETLNVSAIEQLLAETTDAESAEARLIELYRDPETSKFWTMRLGGKDGLRQRAHQIERARQHYDADQFDSCVLQLIAVMDGFVNDFDPEARKGLHSREPNDMAAWDSVVGHHMGLSHAMTTFTKTIKKRVDEEVFDLYRHGIMHGSIVKFDNVVVATKAWNMLFAVADWATATRKAAEPKEAQPSLRDLGATLSRQATYKKHEDDFVASSLDLSDPASGPNEVVSVASEFLDAWEHRRWGIVAKFKPPILRRDESAGQAASETKRIFERFDLKDWTISSATYDLVSSAAVEAEATVDGQATTLRFRMGFWDADGNAAVPGKDDGTWTIAIWAPHTYFEESTETS